MMRSSLAVFPCLALALCAQAGNVLVVAPSGAPFQDIQSAILASADGDLVLVKSGSYPGFSIGDQSVTVVEDTNAIVTISGTVSIGPAGPARTIVLSGIDVAVPSVPIVSGPTLTATAIAGHLRLEGCDIRGWSDGFTYSGGPSDGSPAVQLTSCAHAMIANCTLFGGMGLDGDVFLGPPPGTGGIGLEALASSVALYDSTIRGGWGGQSLAYYDGGHGGIALRVEDCDVFASQTNVWGGIGGQASCCGYSGNGADAVRRAGTTSLIALDVSFVGGQGGGGTNCSLCGPLPQGMNGVGGGATATLNVPGGGRRLAGPAVVRELGAITLTVTGQPGDRVGLYFSFQPQQLLLPAWNGVLTAATAPLTGARLVRIGTIDGTGILTRTFAQPDLGAGVQAQLRFLQIRVAEPGGTQVLGTPLALVALDSSF